MRFRSLQALRNGKRWEATGQRQDTSRKLVGAASGSEAGMR